MVKQKWLHLPLGSSQNVTWVNAADPLGGGYVSSLLHGISSKYYFHTLKTIYKFSLCFWASLAGRCWAGGLWQHLLCILSSGLEAVVSSFYWQGFSSEYGPKHPIQIKVGSAAACGGFTLFLPLLPQLVAPSSLGHL